MTNELKIDLEAQCTATHQWVLVARFKLSTEAGDAARALSNLNGYPYRTIDRRWPDEGVLTTVYERGEGVYTDDMPPRFVAKRNADGGIYLARA